MRNLLFMIVVLSITLIYSSCEKEDIITGTNAKVIVYSDYKETPISVLRVDLYDTHLYTTDLSQRIDYKTTNSSGQVLFENLESYEGSSKLWFRIVSANNSYKTGLGTIKKDETIEKVIFNYKE